MPATGTTTAFRHMTIRRGYGLIGLLITMAIIAVLMSISLSSMNRAVTGEGSTKQGTVHTVEDQTQLYSIYQAFYIQAMNDPRGRGRLLVPSTIAQTDDRSMDTTASLYSAMIAMNYLNPETLISPNEYSPWVEVDTDYNYTSYQPREGQFWDPNFSADLEDRSNVSYAHMPLFGDRFDKHWNSSSRNLVLGNRGPKDGIDDPNSQTYGRNRQWGGHIVFGDGTIKFVNSFTPGMITYEDNGEVKGDNIFRIDDGPGGIDAILGFTKHMTPDGPELMWD